LPPPFHFTTITTYILYSPNSAINEFFNSNTTITRKQYNEFAISRASSVSTTLQIQGFRDKNSVINIGNISLAKTVYPDFVASYKYLGTIGNSRLRNTIKDFTRFFAQSWNNDLRPCLDTTADILIEFQSNFDLLARNLPSRFAPNLDIVRKELPSLFSKALPCVLSHGDLNIINLLVNPKTGNITGIID
ncbi:uncharacterized protein N7458_009121, partial [Penicillium daleae]